MLHGHRSDSREDDGLPIAITDADHVADCEDLGVPGKRQVRLDRNAAGPVNVASSQFGESAGEAGRRDPGSPNGRAASDVLRFALSVLQRNPRGIDPDYGTAGQNRYTQALQ